MTRNQIATRKDRLDQIDPVAKRAGRQSTWRSSHSTPVGTRWSATTALAARSSDVADCDCSALARRFVTGLGADLGLSRRPADYGVQPHCLGTISVALLATLEAVPALERTLHRRLRGRRRRSPASLALDRSRASHTRPCSLRGRPHRLAGSPGHQRRLDRPVTWRAPSQRAELVARRLPGSAGLDNITSRRSRRRQVP
jgi:hypothetical protein